MSLAKAKATGFVIPTWQDALKEFYKQEMEIRFEATLQGRFLFGLGKSLENGIIE